MSGGEKPESWKALDEACDKFVQAFEIATETMLENFPPEDEARKQMFVVASRAATRHGAKLLAKGAPTLNHQAVVKGCIAAMFRHAAETGVTKHELLAAWIELEGAEINPMPVASQNPGNN